MKELNKEYDCDIPLVLMNSFNTHEETVKICQKYANNRVTLFQFQQNRFPLMYRDTLDVVPKEYEEKKK